MARVHDISAPRSRQRPGARGRVATPGAPRRGPGRIQPRPAASLLESLQDLGRDIGAASFERLAPDVLRDLDAEIAERLDEAPLALNEYGFDPWGFEKNSARRSFLVAALLYRYWFRVSTRGIENLPEGRALLIGNHAGQIAIDAAMITVASLLEGLSASC